MPTARVAMVKKGAGEKPLHGVIALADDPWLLASWVSPATGICKDAKASGVGAREPVTARNTLKA